MEPTPQNKSKFRDAAAVILIRGHGDSLEVFWVRRSDRVSFMPGFRAFVGGTVNPDDEALPIAGESRDDRVLVACAIRETFEETGVLLGLAGSPSDDARLGAGNAHARFGRKDAARGLPPGSAATDVHAARALLLADEAPFSALARDYGWRFDASALIPAGRWKTPPFSAARFDTVFFLARVPDDQEPSILPGELESGEWIAPARAIERWRQGEAVFAAPILHTLRELAAGEDRLAERLATAPERAGQPVRRIELSWGIVLQPMKTRPLPPSTHTNAYLVGESEMALIDPGSGEPDELAALFALIETLAAEGRRLTQVLITHAHPDHTGGIAAVRERYRVPIAAHADIAAAVGADRVLADGEIVALAPGVGAWDLRAIHTPGHARGHLCFLHERARALFTGDHVIGGTGTVIVDPDDGDMADYIAALERLATLPIETLFPAHGSPQGAAVRRIRKLIEHRLEREAKVLAALESVPLGLDVLVARVYADTKPALWSYAERSLLAHLIKLEKEGRALRDGERWRLGETARV